MALKHINEIVDRLVHASRAPNSPAALIAHATTEDQNIVETTLSDAKQAAKELSPPHSSSSEKLCACATISIGWVPSPDASSILIRSATTTFAMPDKMTMAIIGLGMITRLLHLLDVVPEQHQLRAFASPVVVWPVMLAGMATLLTS